MGGANIDNSVLWAVSEANPNIYISMNAYSQIVHGSDVNHAVMVMAMAVGRACRLQRLTGQLHDPDNRESDNP